jgi:hypothetical protein
MLVNWQYQSGTMKSVLLRSWPKCRHLSVYAVPELTRSAGSMTRRRGLILSIVTAGCWIILLAIVLNSVFATNKLIKQIRSKDRQSTQGR